MESMPDVSIVSHFKDLPDPRIERAKKHRLIDIIVIALGSIMVGGDGFARTWNSLEKANRRGCNNCSRPMASPRMTPLGALPQSPTLPSVLPVDPGRLQAHPGRRGLARWQNRQSVV